MIITKDGVFMYNLRRTMYYVNGNFLQFRSLGYLFYGSSMGVVMSGILVEDE